MNSLKGQFLVASPHLPDVNFFRTVVLMLDHTEDGASGLVLNRPSNKSIAKIWEILGEKGGDHTDSIYIGGPVPGPILAIHSDEHAADAEVLHDVYMTSQRDRIHRLLQRRDHHFRLYSGYSGWGPGQLDSELTAGGWLTTAAFPHEVFLDADDLWRHVTRRINLEILSATVDISRAPPDARMN